MDCVEKCKEHGEMHALFIFTSHMCSVYVCTLMQRACMCSSVNAWMFVRISAYVHHALHVCVFACECACVSLCISVHPCITPFCGFACVHTDSTVIELFIYDVIGPPG